MTRNRACKKLEVGRITSSAMRATLPFTFDEGRNDVSTNRIDLPLKQELSSSIRPVQQHSRKFHSLVAIAFVSISTFFVSIKVGIFVGNYIKSHKSNGKHFVQKIDTTMLTPQLSSICKLFPNKWGGGVREKMLLLLNDTHHLLEDTGVEYSIDSGTILGLMRHSGHFIPWDHDVDLYIRPSDTSKVAAVVEAHPVYCVELFWGGLKIFRCDDPPIEPNKWAYPFIDLFNTDIAYSGGQISTGGEENLFPSRLGTFEGLTVRLPNNAEAALNKLYGTEWATVCVSSWWDHAREERPQYGGKKVDCAELQEQCGSTWLLETTVQSEVA